MKIFLLPLSLFLVYACSGTKSLQDKTQQVQEEYFFIEIEQNGITHKPTNQEITLSKSPFKIKVNFLKVQGVDVSYSWGKEYYDFPDDENIYNCSKGNYSDECRFFAYKAGAEEANNKNKDIYIGDLDYQFYWAYDDKGYWDKFDHLDSTNINQVVGTVTVENIFDLDKRDLRSHPESEYNYKIEEIKNDIYVVFATSYYKKDMELPKELQRVKFKMKFKED